MAKCVVTGKQRAVGNNVSHANNKTKRTFGANIQKVRIVDANGTKRRVHVSTKAFKSGLVQKAVSRRIEMAQLRDEEAKNKK